MNILYAHAVYGVKACMCLSGTPPALASVCYALSSAHR